MEITPVIVHITGLITGKFFLPPDRLLTFLCLKGDYIIVRPRRIQLSTAFLFSLIISSKTSTCFLSAL